MTETKADQRQSAAARWLYFKTVLEAFGAAWANFYFVPVNQCDL